MQQTHFQGKSELPAAEFCIKEDIEDIARSMLHVSAARRAMEARLHRI